MANLPQRHSVRIVVTPEGEQDAGRHSDVGPRRVHGGDLTTAQEQGEPFAVHAGDRRNWMAAKKIQRVPAEPGGHSTVVAEEPPRVGDNLIPPLWTEAFGWRIRIDVGQETYAPPPFVQDTLRSAVKDGTTGETLWSALERLDSNAALRWAGLRALRPISPPCAEIVRIAEIGF
jgi:hypothetical protein